MQLNRGGFSWNRLLGISGAKSRLSRKIGIPLSRSGRQRKFGAMAGCSMLVVAGVVAFVVTVATMPTVSASSESFCYSLRVHQHEILITVLADGKFCLKMDGVVYRPKAGEISAATSHTSRRTMGKPAMEPVTVNIRQSGERVLIDGFAWIRDSEGMGQIDNREHVYIGVIPVKSKLKAKPLRVDDKSIYRTRCDLTGHSKKLFPMAADAYSFDYYYIDGERVIYVTEMMPRARGESPPPIFTQIVRTLSSRDVESQPKTVQPSGSHSPGRFSLLVSVLVLLCAIGGASAVIWRRRSV